MGELFTTSGAAGAHGASPFTELDSGVADELGDESFADLPDELGHESLADLPESLEIDDIFFAPGGGGPGEGAAAEGDHAV